jgi:hypothetical protein
MNLKKLIQTLFKNINPLNYPFIHEKGDDLVKFGVITTHCKLN